MNTLLVTALEESSGKTAIALALGLLARDRGAVVGYMKPKGTRLQSRVGKTLDADPMLAAELLNLDDDMADLEPIVYSQTFIEGAIRHQEDPEVLRDSVSESFERLAGDRDFMVLEGGGTLTTGGIIDLTDREIADLLDARVVLVVGYHQPGDLDEVLAAAELLGDRLAGIVFNRVAETDYDSLEGDVVPFLEGEGIPVLGVVPRSKELAGVTVSELATELGADHLTDAPTDAFIERFSVGAMSGDAALRHFRRAKDAAVITGGDRSEIHTAALEAPGVKCLVLTGGFRPSGAVIGTAEERGIPILLVQSDTLTTIERMEAIVHGGRTRDERTVTRMRELLFEHADVDALLGEAIEK